MVRSTTFRLATRWSPLARFQAELVARLLRDRSDVDGVELVPVETTGDENQQLPISSFQGRGVFTSAVERCVMEGRADAAVHSAKDLPATEDDGALELIAIPNRADVRDALIGARLDELAPGAVIATGSIRRRVQLASYRPDLGFSELRGNIATRLAKATQFDAVVIAYAALERLDLSGHVAEVLSTKMMLPQVGQGAIAVRCRRDDADAVRILRAIDDPIAHIAVRAERAFLQRIGAGCTAPVGAYATCGPLGAPIEIEAMIASTDGHVVLRRRLSELDPIVAGTMIAERLLEDDGGAALLGNGGGQ